MAILEIKDFNVTYKTHRLLGIGLQILRAEPVVLLLEALELLREPRVRLFQAPHVLWVARAARNFLPQDFIFLVELVNPVVRV